jgi:hypothetical protein
VHAKEDFVLGIKNSHSGVFEKFIKGDVSHESKHVKNPLPYACFGDDCFYVRRLWR